MICHICKVEHIKLAKAHLLPDSLKKISQPFRKPSDHLVEVHLQQEGVRKIQTHLFDKTILCADCDNGLGQYDEAMKNFIHTWYHSKQRDPSILNISENSMVMIPADTRKVSIGLATSLYRCAISKRCTTVLLGDVYERRMSTFLKEDRKLKFPPNFSVKMLGVTKHKNGLCGTMTTPYVRKIEGVRVHMFELFGLNIFAKFGQTRWPKILEPLSDFNQLINQANIQLIPFENSNIEDRVIMAGNAQKIWAR